MTDNSIGGFTILPNKIRRKPQKVAFPEPEWMKTPTVFSENVNDTAKLSEISLLDRTICKRLKKMGMKHCFPVQKCAFENLLMPRPQFERPHDICIRAPTGSGKTLAYAVPIVQHLMSNTSSPLLNHCTQALIILPTRDLALQVYQVFQQLTKKCALNVALLNGQMNFFSEQKLLISQENGHLYCCQDIVVCTPGRLTEHIRLSDGFLLDAVQFLVLDESDELMAKSNYHWFDILDRELYLDAFSNKVVESSETNGANSFHFGKRSKPSHDKGEASKCLPSGEIPLQKILVSATLTMDPAAFVKFNLFSPLLLAPCKEVVPSSLKVGKETNNIAEGAEENHHLTTTSSSVPFILPHTLKAYIVPVSLQHRPMFLLDLIVRKHPGGILCFTNTRERAHTLCDLLNNTLALLNKGSAEGDQEEIVKAISARLLVQQRDRILDKFRSGQVKAIICSDGIARGMDFPNVVNCVVSYNKPGDVTTYVHRVGRCARAGQEGTTYTLLETQEVHSFRKMIRPLGKPCPEKPFYPKRMKRYAEAFQAAQTMECTKKPSKSSKKSHAKMEL